jgi:hypothetical protein
MNTIKGESIRLLSDIDEATLREFYEEHDEKTDSAKLSSLAKAKRQFVKIKEGELTQARMQAHLLATYGKIPSKAKMGDVRMAAGGTSGGSSASGSSGAVQADAGVVAFVDPITNASTYKYDLLIDRGVSFGDAVVRHHRALGKVLQGRAVGATSGRKRRRRFGRAERGENEDEEMSDFIVADDEEMGEEKEEDVDEEAVAEAEEAKVGRKRKKELKKESKKELVASAQSPRYGYTVTLNAERAASARALAAKALAECEHGDGAGSADARTTTVLELSRLIGIDLVIDIPEPDDAAGGANAGGDAREQVAIGGGPAADPLCLVCLVRPSNSKKASETEEEIDGGGDGGGDGGDDIEMEATKTADELLKDKFEAAAKTGQICDVDGGGGAMDCEATRAGAGAPADFVQMVRMLVECDGDEYDPANTPQMWQLLKAKWEADELSNKDAAAAYEACEGGMCGNGVLSNRAQALLDVSNVPDDDVVVIDEDPDGDPGLDAGNATAGNATAGKAGASGNGAADDGVNGAFDQVKVGDQLLEVNGQPVRGQSARALLQTMGLLGDSRRGGDGDVKIHLTLQAPFTRSELGSTSTGFYISKKKIAGSYKLFLAVPKADWQGVIDEGDSSQEHSLLKPNIGSSGLKLLFEIRKTYRKVSAGGMRKTWSRQYKDSTAPDYKHGQRNQFVTLLAGSISPIWNTLQSMVAQFGMGLTLTERSLKAVRAELGDGRRIVGIRFPDEKIGAELKRSMEQLKLTRAMANGGKGVCGVQEVVPVNHAEMQKIVGGGYRQKTMASFFKPAGGSSSASFKPASSSSLPSSAAAFSSSGPVPLVQQKRGTTGIGLSGRKLVPSSKGNAKKPQQKKSAPKKTSASTTGLGLGKSGKMQPKLSFFKPK